MTPVRDSLRVPLIEIPRLLIEEAVGPRVDHKVYEEVGLVITATDVRAAVQWAVNSTVYSVVGGDDETD